MNSPPKNTRAFKNIEAARKRFRKSNGPQRILVLNQQGLPIMQMSSIDDFAFIIDDEECAEVVDLARTVYNSIQSYRGIEPYRIAFFFNDEVITVERTGPFIILVNWQEEVFRRRYNSETYIERLESTLFEELS
ncbi:hypothetical protein HQ587_08575 [bacterium]|nr:hypothetical protein [bacterium]